MGDGDPRAPDQGGRARVAPGQPLGFVDTLRKAGMWPLPVGYLLKRSLPVMTPYLVIPSQPGDSGARPLAGDAALHSPAVEVVDATTGNPTTTPVAGGTYVLRCRVDNLGGAGAYGGLAEFYLAQPAALDEAALTPGTTMAAKGYAGFVALPGTSVTVSCPNRWSPATDAEATCSVLVQVHDPFIDALATPFSAREDRHVGRRDTVPDFNGVWEGSGTSPDASLARGHQLVRIIISQTGRDVTAAIYAGQAGALPFTPLRTVAGSIGDAQVELAYSDPDDPRGVIKPSVWHTWALALTDADNLHFEHRLLRQGLEEPIRGMVEGGLRRILVPDFSGTWDGFALQPAGHTTSGQEVDFSTPVRLAIAQDRLAVTVAIYEAGLAQPLPAQPEATIPGRATTGQLHLTYAVGDPGGASRTEHDWVIAMPDGGGLAFQHHARTTNAGSTVETLSHGTLHRL